MKNDSKWIGLLLDSSGFIVVNKALIRALGLEGSVLLGELISEYNYYEKINELTEKVWFYSTTPNIEEQTGLFRKTIEKNITKLKNESLIDVKIIGMPRKRYIKINFKEVEKFIKKSIKVLPSRDKNTYKQGQKDIQVGTKKHNSKDKKTSKKGQKNIQVGTKDTINNNNNKNKKKNNKTNLILQQEDEMRNTSLFNSFYKNTDIDNILKEHPSYIDIAENVYNIAKNIYLSSKEYEIIGGNKITLDNLKETLNSYDKDKMNYVLESLFYNSKDKIQKLDKYIMATLYNAPRTYALFKSKKANKQMQELNKNIEKHNNTTFIYDFKTFK